LRRALALCLCLLLTAAWAQELELHFIDVGQGDSVLVRAPGGKNVLYDGGRSASTALEYLQALGVTSLDVVVASHADADHIGGLPAVLRAYRPRFYVESPVGADSLTFLDLEDAVNESVGQVIDPVDRRLLLGDVSLQTLPPPNDPALGRNSNSVGIIVS
jgi:competence protein ComEC